MPPPLREQAAGARPVAAPLPDLLARTLLLPVALAATGGVMLDRYVGVPLGLAGTGVLAALAAWGGCWAARRGPAAVLFLWVAAGLLGAAWHQVRQRPYPDDIGRHATDEPRLVRLRGSVRELTHEPIADSSLRSRQGQVRTALVVEAAELRTGADWFTVRGKAQVWVGARLTGAQVGDEVELTGELHAIPPPANPGEFDARTFAHGQGVRAILHVKTLDGVAVRRRAPWGSLGGTLAAVRAWGNDCLQQHLPDPQAGVAQALLLGERRAMEREELDRYVRTGIVHVLAISGQHLAILCGGLWVLCRVPGTSRRRVAGFVAAFAIGYALLTGGHPPVVRSAVLVAAVCLGAFLGARTQPLNTLALAWLVLIALNPADLFQTGCQLSFLSVLVIVQIVLPWRQWSANRDDPLADLVEQARPHWQRLLLEGWSRFVWLFRTGLVVWLTLAPLLAARYNLVSPVAVLLSPPVIVLTAVALFAGFLLLVQAPLGGLLSGPLAWILDLSLRGCAWLVRLGEVVPGAYWYCCRVPEWWLWGFYLGLLAVLLLPGLKRCWKPALAVAAVWLGLGLFAARADDGPKDELRCTVLAVGHGSCVLIETPDGRVFLYDAGSLTGPQVAARQIAPALWSRGITRIDEVFLSHADLDHFNGVPDLLDRFRIAQVSLTPTFAVHPQAGSRLVCGLLDARGVPVRVLHAGQQLRAGEVTIDVLHPPPAGPAGPENARSLVLLVQFRGSTILLTGDLESPGLEQVMARPAPPVDVLLAPHHGSPASNTAAFAAWSKPGLVISSEGRPRGRRPDPYSPLGAAVWRTSQEGAVTVVIDDAGIRAETYRSHRRWSKTHRALPGRVEGASPFRGGRGEPVRASCFKVGRNRVLGGTGARLGRTGSAFELSQPFRQRFGSGFRLAAPDMHSVLSRVPTSGRRPLTPPGAAQVGIMRHIAAFSTV